MDKCGDNRFEIIEKAKQDLLNSTNMDSSKDEMKVLDNFLFRCWQMGWLNQYNLTSDAEGEDDEMLYVSRKKLQYFYERLRKVGENHAAFALQSLFGSKCLPDETKDGTKDDTKEPKPAEPKFTKDDMVHCKSFGYEGDYKVLEYTGGPRNCYDCIDKYGAYYRFYESDLEPYIEPTNLSKSPETCTDDCSSQSASQDFDGIVKDGFREHNRMHIAAMAMHGILTNPDEVYRAETCTEEKQTPQAIAKYALACADALIAECGKKGGLDGED